MTNRFSSQSGRWSSTGHRCLCPVFRTLVYDVQPTEWFHPGQAGTTDWCRWASGDQLLTNREGETATVTLSLHITETWDDQAWGRRTLQTRVGKSGHHLYGRWIRSDRSRKKPLKALQYGRLIWKQQEGKSSLPKLQP